ncbi:MAG TPA: prenyltransferase [Candidatus Syntrophoarchaeum butanivorans]|uniref:Prenyltransferase n=1 Tax=Candidatus Syntropharchaeum butanivorans TaxID=1839936 RepID=A0A1F2P6T4_9EURY|nr:MAG: prenyltransferase [Candidatus Syntrophoarchaeum butanivorans]HDM35837.1 prenyltransferase [Candidatus Syntrophoarchaeum butanivorans]HEC57528.1 prenyltransferase [Candidatus Syntrophoarchaeum butanivorans]
MGGVRPYLKAVWRLTRAEHGLMYAVGVVVGAVLGGARVSDAQVVLSGCITAIMLEAGTFALNDYYDFEVDRKNNRLDRPLVTGEIGLNEAFIMGWTLIAAGMLFALFLPIPCLLLAFIAAVLGVLYDIKLKETGPGGNLYISLTMALPFVFGGLLVKPEPDLILLVLASIAFLIGFGREVMKGIVDIEGDAIRDVSTIARRWGVKRAKQISALFYLIGITISPIPFLINLNPSYFMNIAYLVPLVFADLILLHVTFRLPSEDREGVDRLRSVSLIALLSGLIAFLAGAMIQLPLGGV